MPVITTAKGAIALGYSVIAVSIGGFGGWASVAPLDSAVIASGTVIFEGQKRPIQHLEGGILKRILVREGDRVKAGDVLIEMNQIRAEADLSVIQQRLHEAAILDLRLQSEMQFLPTVVIKDAELASATGITTIVTDQSRILSERLSILASEKLALKNQRDQLDQELIGLIEQQAAVEERLTIQEQLLNRLRQGEQRGVINTNELAEREDVFIQLKAQKGGLTSDIARTRIAKGEAEIRLKKLDAEFRERAIAEQKTVRQQLAELTATLRVTSDVLARTKIYAPTDGTVQNVKVFSEGRVIQSGEMLMEIVPDEDKLVISATIMPNDIDSVEAGMEAEIKFPAINARFADLSTGRIQTVSRDIINVSEVLGPTYDARIEVDSASVPDEVRQRITAGMPAELVFKTQERTLLQFMVQPLTDALRVSMREE